MKPIRVLVVPADLNQEMEYRDLSPDDLGGMQALVGGYIEHITLHTPEAIIYFNEDGRSLSLPPNARASDIVYAHCPVDIGNIVGDAFISGPVRRGWQTSVPGDWKEE